MASSFDKKKVTTYINKITHDTDKNGAIMPFRIAYHSGDSYTEFTREEKLEICTLFIRDCNNAIFSDVYDVRDFPVLLKDAVYREKDMVIRKPLTPVDIAPTISKDTKPDAFQDAFLKFIAQRDNELVVERAPLQLDVQGFGEDVDAEYADYDTIFKKNNIVASQIYDVKAPTSAPINFNDAFERYKAELQNPSGFGLSSSEAEAAAEFNRAMAEKQQLYDAEKQKYTDKIQGDMVEDIMQKRMNELPPRIDYIKERIDEMDETFRERIQVYDNNEKIRLEEIKLREILQQMSTTVDSG